MAVRENHQDLELIGDTLEDRATSRAKIHVDDPATLGMSYDDFGALKAGSKSLPCQPCCQNQTRLHGWTQLNLNQQLLWFGYQQKRKQLKAARTD